MSLAQEGGEGAEVRGLGFGSDGIDSRHDRGEHGWEALWTIAFNFLDLEELDADYERSVGQAERVASLIQASADADSLGSSFLSTASDPFVSYIQRVRFEPGSAGVESTARAAGPARSSLQGLCC